MAHDRGEPTAATAAADALEVRHLPGVDDATAERLYAAYRVAFEPLRAAAAARQVLHREEFLALVGDPRVVTVVGSLGGEPAVVAVVTNHLESVPWISPEYFRARFPDHASRHAIYYLPVAFVVAEQQGEHLLDELLQSVAGWLLGLDAVCGFDLCAYNNRVFAFADRIEAALRRVSAVDLEVVDTQRFYAVRPD